jgi:RNA polymerase sigma-70 factor (ECF subfamily)
MVRGADRLRHEGEQVQSLPTYSQSASAGVPATLVLTDEEIVRRVSAGDVQMFEVLMRRYNQRLYRAARAILQDDAEAEDTVQQAYLNAYRHLDQFEGRAQFSTWLTRIAVYEALARRRRAYGQPAGSEDELVETAPSPAPDPERQAYGREVSVLLESALAALPDAYRSVFILREIDGLNTAETAQQLRVSEGTVKTRLHRAKSLLQRKLQAVTPGEAYGFDGVRCDRLVAGVMHRLADLNADAPGRAPQSWSNLTER